MNEVLKTIHSIHSTHGNFTDKHIPEQDLDTILNASVQAACSGPLTQNYAIVVVDDKDVMKEISGYVADRMLVYCVDFSRNIEIADYVGQTYVPGPSWAVVTGITDVILAAQNAVLAAHSLSIDSLISNGVQRGDPHRGLVPTESSKDLLFPGYRRLSRICGFAADEEDHASSYAGCHPSRCLQPHRKGYTGHSGTDGCIQSGIFG